MCMSSRVHRGLYVFNQYCAVINADVNVNREGGIHPCRIREQNQQRPFVVSGHDSGIPGLQAGRMNAEYGLIIPQRFQDCKETLPRDHTFRCVTQITLTSWYPFFILALINPLSIYTPCLAIRCTPSLGTRSPYLRRSAMIITDLTHIDAPKFELH